MTYVLGIDGGGSRTRAAVSNGTSVFAAEVSKGCNLNTVSQEQARVALSEAVRQALMAAEVPAEAVLAACAGVAGGAAPDRAAEIAAMLSDLLPSAKVQAVGDTVIALQAAFAHAPGVICISGTGSVAFGRNERGDFTRAGGWGRIVSDEGSGHWIGQRAVSHILRAMDEGRSSPLITAIMLHWQIATREQLVLRCHRDPIPNFSELFPVVQRVAESGDVLANDILDSAGTRLARITQIVLRRLWTTPGPHEVAMTGSVFAHSARVRHVFCNLIRASSPEMQVRLSRRPPIEGALELAWESLGEIGQTKAAG